MGLGMRKKNVTTESGYKPLSAVDLAICSRLGSCRRSAKISQAELAAKIGITRNQLTNIESGRVALTYHIGWRACEYLNVSLLWLAGRSLQQHPFDDLGKGPLKDSLDKDMLFSEPFTDRTVSFYYNKQTEDMFLSLASDYGALEVMRLFYREMKREAYFRIFPKIAFHPGLSDEAKHLWMMLLARGDEEVSTPKGTSVGIKYSEFFDAKLCTPADKKDPGK